ncbi:hypothetical protein NM688_g2607 [Phlebia brevispora]|uniref:Uncharacterized protein n=1 Tax=Phlebia brevispora TaxID=194682 RepID=A0ACC1T7W7_9APHY|nr:hypothetical protein NM688_g2607 [Phlebia brevispora]
MSQAVEDNEELARFREEWKAEVRRNRGAYSRPQDEQVFKLGLESAPSQGKLRSINTQWTQPTAAGSSRSAHIVHLSDREAAIEPATLPPTLVRALEVYSRAKRTSIDGVEQVTRDLEHASVSCNAKPSTPAVSGKLADILVNWPHELSFEPEEEKEPVHIRLLPTELLLKILRYLDTTSLERFAAINRKARVLTLDTSIWRPFVNHIYRPPEIGEDEDIPSLMEKYSGIPRRMYIEHPRVRLDGVYIAVCHYTRPGLGESVWVNVSHLVTYRRYLRFYPSGQVLSLLTNEGENPQHSIPKLQLTSREKSLYIGSWRLEGTTVIITDLLEVLGDSPKYTFQMTLDLRSRPLGRWNRLSLAAYETVSIADGEALPLPLKNERPFWFSKVRSYNS